jgi:rsbT antagonist protein RsbS
MSEQAAFSHVRGCLVVTLLGEIDVESLGRLQEALLPRIAAVRARGVILDASTVTVLDPDDVAALARTLSMCRLLGAPAVVVGLSVDLVEALVSMDVPLDGLDAEVSVERGLDLLLSEPVRAA